MMFECQSGTSVNVESTWKASRKMKSRECQTRKISTGEAETQTAVKKSVQVQASPSSKRSEEEEEKEKEVEEVVVSFLNKILPCMEEALKENQLTMFREGGGGLMSEMSSSSGDAPSEIHSFTYEFSRSSETWKSEKEADEMGMHVMGVSWNSTGSTLCVAYGRRDHTSWCCMRAGTRPGFCAWNVFRKDLDPRVPHIVCETQCCLTCIACHPENPALVAVGTFNGEILVFNTALCGTKEDPLIAQSRIDDCFHHEPVSSICWILEYDGRGKNRIFNIATTSGGGKVLTWSLKNNLLAPRRGFRVSSKSASRHSKFGGASMSFVKTRHHVGVSASSLVIGTESGRVFRCFRTISSINHEEKPSMPTQTSRNSMNWTFEGLRALGQVESSSRLSVRSHVETYARRIKANSIDDVVFYASRPDVEKIYPTRKGFEFQAHVGPVYALDTSPFERNAFLTGGADGEIRLCSMLQSRPLRVFDVSSFVYDISWSPNCPMVFAAATMRDGIQIYDMTLDTFEPIHRIASSGSSSSDNDDEKETTHHARSVTCISFNPKQRSLLASGTAFGTVRVYKLPRDITSERSGEEARLNKLLNELELDGDDN